MGNIAKRLYKIMEIGPESLRNALENDINTWAPEDFQKNLELYVKEYVAPNSMNPITVRIYALAMDCSEDRVIEEFGKNGY